MCIGCHYIFKLAAHLNTETHSNKVAPMLAIYPGLNMSLHGPFRIY